MAAYTGDQPNIANATSTSFVPSTNLLNFLNFNLILNSNNYVTETFFQDPYETAYVGDTFRVLSFTSKPITSTNAQAYTTYPKIP